MRGRRTLIALSALAVVAAGLTLAPSASADSVQVQSYQRASAAEACAAQPGETPWQAAWGSDPTWHPTWERWANGATGGWTCTRSIVWAKSTPLGCTQIQVEGDSSLPAYSDFGSGYVVPRGSPYYTSPSCSEAAGVLPFAFVWATDQTIADALCNSAQPGIRSTPANIPNIYGCNVL
jgi:hypothetical protein